MKEKMLFYYKNDKKVLNKVLYNYLCPRNKI